MNPAAKWANLKLSTNLKLSADLKLNEKSSCANFNISKELFKKYVTQKYGNFDTLIPMSQLVTFHMTPSL